MATTNLSRMLVWSLGLILVLAAIVLLWNATGLDRYISNTVLMAVLLIILGIGVMAIANRTGFWGTRRVDYVEHRRDVAPGYGPGYAAPGAYPGERVESRRVVEDDDDRRSVL